ncbi:flagella cluster protein [Natronolimnobius sp. AArcel1]|uniref:DUF7500 family protein n=1 Tax=Natronolimnobius sp. AArcel1 TaxID=1679093 RepID=UPI0013E9EE4D|nr:flagella cluster protein [Natronolimnobius sp. AArcel1]NGM70145.1 flagella cluster protein [Natronolimnobius sp. AArcel1]
MTKGNEGSDPKENADVPPVLPNEKQPSTSSRSRGALSPEDLDFTDSPYVDEIDDGRYVVSADRRPSSGPSGTQGARNATSTQASANDSATQQATSDTHGGSGDNPGSSAHGGDTPAAESNPPDPAPTQSQPAASPLESSPHNSSAYQSPQSPQPPQEPSRPQSPEAARSLLASELEHVETRYAIDIVSRFGDETARHRTASDDAVGTFNSLLFWYARHVSGRTPTNRAAELLLEKSDFTPALSKRQVERAMRTHDLDGSSTLDELLEALE